MASVPDTLLIPLDKEFVIKNSLEEIKWEGNKNNSAPRTLKFYNNFLDRKSENNDLNVQ